jgi:O-antigen/teichoic acid export membrane protein
MVAAGSSWLVAGRLSQSLIAVLGMAVLARLLSPQDFGVLALSNAPILLLSAITVGFIDFPAVRDNDLSDTNLRSLIWTCFALISVFAVAIWFGSPYAERALGFPRLAEVMRGRIPFTFVYVIVTACMAVLRRAHRFRAISALSILNIAVYVVLTISMALSGFGMWSLVLGHLASISVVAIVAVALTRIPLAPPRRIKLFGVGSPAVMGAFSRAVVWSWSNIDTIAVGAVAGPAVTGLYNRAYNINHHLKEPFAAMDATLRQALAVLNARGGDYADQVDQALRLVTIGAALVAAAVISARTELVLLLLGDNWRPAAPILAMLIVGLPARAVLIFLDGLSASVASLSSTVVRNLVLLALVVVGVLLAGPYGAEAVAASVSACLYMAIFLPLSVKARGITLPRIARAMLPGLLIGAVLAACGEGVRDALPDHFWWRSLGLAAFYAVALVTLALALPEGWLGGPLAKVRRGLLSRLGFSGPAQRPTGS